MIAMFGRGVMKQRFIIPELIVFIFVVQIDGRSFHMSDANFSYSPDLILIILF